MSFLLDTNVISEFANDKPHQLVATWLREHQAAELFLSVVTIGELQQGIARLPASRRKERLAHWLDESLLITYADWILPINTSTMQRWGKLTAQRIAVGRTMPVMDALIAATALEHSLTLVTRNVSDFSNMGLHIVNPWDR